MRECEIENTILVMKNNILTTENCNLESRELVGGPARAQPDPKIGRTGRSAG